MILSHTPRVYLATAIADTSAPTMAEITSALDLGPWLTSSGVSWHSALCRWDAEFYWDDAGNDPWHRLDINAEGWLIVTSSPDAAPSHPKTRLRAPAPDPAPGDTVWVLGINVKGRQLHGSDDPFRSPPLTWRAHGTMKHPPTVTTIR